MKALYIAACEDSGADLDFLQEQIHLCELPVIIHTFTRAEDLLEVFRPAIYDLVFLDIYMEGMKGIDAAARIRELDEHIVIAFTTTSTDHALDAYRLGALKYLEKPVTVHVIKETLELALLKRKMRKSITLLIGGKMTEILLDTVLYFGMESHTVLIHLENEVLRVSQTVRMDDIEKMVPTPQFLRCHRGFIVNLLRVCGFSGPDFIMDNGDKVYIRLKDAPKMKQLYERYIFSLTRGGKE